MIHDYLVMLSFLSLGFIIVSTASFLNTHKFLVGNTAHDGESLRFRRKSRIWRKITLIFIISLLFSRLFIFLIGPSELISKGFYSPEYIKYFILCAFFTLLWSLALYFKYLQRYFKPELVENFQNKIAGYQMILVLTDLVITGYFFVKGYTGLFEPSPSGLAVYRYVNPENYIYFIVILFILVTILIIFYTLFLVRRSLHFLKQYLGTFFILLCTCVLYAIMVSFHFLGWNESLALNLKLLSWHYGYIGWIYIALLCMSLYTIISILIILLLKNHFLDDSRIRLILLPLLKAGFAGLIAFSLLTISPVVMNLI